MSKDLKKILIEKAKGNISPRALSRKQSPRKKTPKRSQMIALLILRRLRELKMNQIDLAEKLDISPQQVNKWVKGNVNFTIDTIEKIEDALDCNLITVSIKNKSLSRNYKRLPFNQSMFKVNNTGEFKTGTTQIKVIPMKEYSSSKKQTA